jgi:hypothetical protein
MARGLSVGHTRGAPLVARHRAWPLAAYAGELARCDLGGLSQVEAFEHPEALEALAVVLAEYRGDPVRLMDGEPLPSQT